MWKRSQMWNMLLLHNVKCVFAPGLFWLRRFGQDVSPPDILDLDVLPPPLTFWTRTLRPLTIWTWTFYPPPDILDQDTSPPDNLDLDVSPPDILDQEVSPRTCWTWTFRAQDVSPRPRTFWTWTFRSRTFWTSSFRPLTFWSRTFRPYRFGPGRFAPWYFGPECFAPWDFGPERFAPDVLDLDVLHPGRFVTCLFGPGRFAHGRFGPGRFAPNILDPANCLIIQNTCFSWKFCHLGEFTWHFSWRCFTIHVTLWRYVRDYASQTMQHEFMMKYSRRIWNSLCIKDLFVTPRIFRRNYALTFPKSSLKDQ